MENILINKQDFFFKQCIEIALFCKNHSNLWSTQVGKFDWFIYVGLYSTKKQMYGLLNLFL